MNPLLRHGAALPLLALATALPLPATDREFRFLAWDGKVADRSVAVVSDRNLTEIEDLHPLQRTPPVRASVTEGQLGLVALDHENAEEATFSVSLPADPGPLLILLKLDPESPAGLRGFALADSQDDFPWGSFRIINATDRPVLVRLGEAVKTLPTGFMPVDIAPPEGNHPVMLAARDEPDRPVYSSVWSADPETRRLVFVMPGTEVRLGRVSLKVIPEIRQPQAR